MLTTTIRTLSALASTRLMNPIFNSNSPFNQSFFYNPLSHLSICTHENRSLRYLTSDGKRMQTDNNSKTDFAISCTSTDKQGDLIPFGPILNSWKAWIVGGLLTVILPLLTKNWAPLLKWTKTLESVEEKIEEIVEAVEKVGEEVEKVAEEIEEKLPEGGKLSSALKLVEKAAKEVVKDADKIEELIDKVENVEKKVDAMIEAEIDKSSAVTKVETPSA